MGPRQRKAAIYLLLGLTTLAVYAQVHRFEFTNYDDREYVTQNPVVRQGLTLNTAAWACRSLEVCNYHPVTWLSHMLDVEWFGMWAGGHHLSSVVLHGLGSCLLLAAMAGLTGTFYRSALVAFLFALHPMHVESVAWVAERKDVLHALFWILTLLAYAAYARRPGQGRYLIVTGFFLLGLLSKSMVVTLPAVLLLLDYWPLGRINPAAIGHPWTWRRWAWLAAEKAPLLALSLAIAMAAVVAQRAGGALVDTSDHALSQRLAGAVVAYALYIFKLAWPTRLAVFYPIPHAIAVWQIVLSSLLLTGISAAVWLGRKRCPYLLVGWLWFVITLLPVIGLIQVGSQFIADRYTYVPSIGLFIMIAWGLCDLARSSRSRQLIFTAAAVAWVLVLSLLAWRQVGVWQNSQTLFTHARHVTQNNPVACLNLGQALLEKGEVRQAIAVLREAQRLRPLHGPTLASLSQALAQGGDWQGSLEMARRAVQANEMSGVAHLALGLAIARLGDPEQALVHLRRGVYLDRSNPEGHNNLGVALAQTGRWSEAVAEFREALRLKPDSPKFRLDLENALRLEQAAVSAPR